MGAILGDGVGRDVERDDGRGALPQYARMGVADEACVDPIFDKALSAIHFYGRSRDGDIVAAGAELDQWCQEAQVFAAAWSSLSARSIMCAVNR